MVREGMGKFTYNNGSGEFWKNFTIDFYLDNFSRKLILGEVW